MPPEQHGIRRAEDDQMAGNDASEEEEVETEPVSAVKEKKRYGRVRTVSFTEFGSDSGDSEIVCNRKFVGDYMDRYLDTIGLRERSVQRDGKSFFRAICEEIFLVQTEEIVDEVQSMIEATMDFDCKTHDSFIGPLPKPDKKRDMIHATAKIFEAVIQVFRKSKTIPAFYNPPDDIVPKREILLMEVIPGHFNRIIKKHTAEVAGHVQAILYRSLYEQVFGMRQSVISEGIYRTRKEAEISRWDLDGTGRCNNRNYCPPVPFCVLKAMDPCIYRNTCLDELAKKRGRNLGKVHVSPEKRVFLAGSECIYTEHGLEEYGIVLAIYTTSQRVVKFQGGYTKVVNISNLTPVEPSDSMPAPGIQPTAAPPSQMNNHQHIVNGTVRQGYFMKNAPMAAVFPHRPFINTFPPYSTNGSGIPAYNYPNQPNGGFGNQYMFPGSPPAFSSVGTYVGGPYNGYLLCRNDAGASAPVPLMNIPIISMNGCHPAMDAGGHLGYTRL